MAELKLNKIQHPEIVLAQARLETGGYTSKVCGTCNNLFGLRKGDSYSFLAIGLNQLKHTKTNSIQIQRWHYYAQKELGTFLGDPYYTSKLRDII